MDLVYALNTFKSGETVHIVVNGKVFDLTIGVDLIECEGDKMTDYWVKDDNFHYFAQDCIANSVVNSVVTNHETNTITVNLDPEDKIVSVVSGELFDFKVRRVYL